MPVVSVIMGVYNTKDLSWLEKSVDSVLKQSFGDFEFIICDDCSERYIKEFLRDISECDVRIKIIENEANMGLAASLNRCIEMSQGKYIFRQDDDDFSEPDRFMKQVDFLEANPDVAIVGSNISYFDDSGRWGVLRYPESPCKKDFLFLVPFMHGAIAFRKDSLISAGCYDVSKLMRRTEDYELFMRMYALGFRGYNLQESLYSFREDKTAHKRRRYRYKVDEFRVRLSGFKALGLMPVGLIYVVKPLVVGLLPYRLLNLFKDVCYKRKNI